MSLQVYPTLPGLTFPILRRMSFNTDKQTAPNKYETRLPQTVNPFYEWQLVYDFLRDFPVGSFTVGELRALEDFFFYQLGSAGDFLFTDPNDNSVGPALNPDSSPNTPLAQLQIVNDGAGNYYSPIQRTFGGLAYEDITDLNGAITVYANGVLQALGTNYTVMGPGLALPNASYMGLYLKWAAEPTGPITVQFNFYFRVHFQSDEQDMENFVNQFWTIGGSESKNGKGYLTLESSRPNPL